VARTVLKTSGTGDGLLSLPYNKSELNEKRGKKPSLIFNIVSVWSFVLSLFVGALLWNRSIDKKLDQCTRYVVGRVDRVNQRSMRPTNLVYSFTFNDEKVLGYDQPDVFSFDDWMRRSGKYYRSRWQG